MRVLHLASHEGNIGDNASHGGLYSILSNMGYELTVEKEEIRKYYDNYPQPGKKHFDSEFLEKTKANDVIVIGGGNFLEYNRDSSSTGTTININSDLLSKIEKPIIFSGVGCTLKSPPTENSKSNFGRFLGDIRNKERLFFSLRNDGSMNEIESDFSEHTDWIKEVLDSGFFFKPDSSFMRIKEDYVCINVSEDQVQEAFSRLGSHDYFEAIATAVEYIVKRLNLKVVFVPHIYSDLSAINSVLNILEPFIVRSDKVIVAPYWQGDAGANALFSIYSGSRFVLATRLHANICSLASGKEVICLPVLDRVEHIYKKLSMMGNVVSCDDFKDSLIEKVDLASAGKLTILDANNSAYTSLREQTIMYYKNAFQSLASSVEGN